MKKYLSIISIYVFIACMSGIFTSCSDNDKSPSIAISSPFKSITAEDGTVKTDAIISDEEQTIWLPFRNKQDLSDIIVTFIMAERASLKSPVNKTAILDLTIPEYEVIVNNGVTDIIYKITTAKPVEKILSAVTAKDGDMTINGIISDKSKRILLQFNKEKNLSDVNISFKLEKGASLVSLPSTTTNLNLSTSQIVTFNNGVDNIDYMILASSPTENIYEKTGWKNVTDAYGPLPPYINAYKIDTLDNKAKNIASLTVIDGNKATMAILGDGMNASNQPYLRVGGVEKQYPEWPLFFLGIGGLQSPPIVVTIINDNKIIQKPSWKCPGTIGRTSDGKIKISYASVIDNQLYAFDTPVGNNNPDKSKGTLWNAVAATSGYSLIVKNGKTYGDYATLVANDGRPENGNDAKIMARGAIGVTENNQVLLFVCQAMLGSVGTNLESMAELLKDLGCKDVLAFEEGTNALTRLNRKSTVLTGDFYNAEGILQPSNTGRRSECFVVFK